MAKIYGYLKGGIETKCSSDFLKYMWAILKKSPKNEGDGVPTSHLLSPNDGSSTRTELNPIELLACQMGPMKIPKLHRLLPRQ